MPIHDWTRVDPGLFHHFHQDWTVEICRTLNRGVLPTGFEALTEGKVLGWEPDVLAIQSPETQPGGGAPPLARPVSQLRAKSEPDAVTYARRANRVAIRYKSRAVVAVIEIVSPGNKHSAAAVEQFRDKALEFLERGVSLVVIDLFPPTRRDPGGLHRVIWNHVASDPLPPAPDDKPLSAAAFDATDGLEVFIDPLAVGDVLPNSPLFLATGWYVPLPLEATYMRSCEELTPSIRAELNPPSA